MTGFCPLLCALLFLCATSTRPAHYLCPVVWVPSRVLSTQSLPWKSYVLQYRLNSSRASCGTGLCCLCARQEPPRAPADAVTHTLHAAERVHVLQSDLRISTPEMFNRGNTRNMSHGRKVCVVGSASIIVFQTCPITLLFGWAWDRARWKVPAVKHASQSATGHEQDTSQENRSRKTQKDSHRGKARPTPSQTRSLLSVTPVRHINIGDTRQRSNTPRQNV